MASDLREFIQKEVLSRSRFKTVFLLGHSMGGKVAAEFGLQDAEVLFFNFWAISLSGCPLTCSKYIFNNV